MNPSTSFGSVPTTAGASSSESDDTPAAPHRFIPYEIPKTPSTFRSLSILSGHTESVSCIALCGEFILTASHGKEIIVWQQPDLRQFTKFGHGRGSVKAVVTAGDKIFTAHQDSKIRVWTVSRNSSQSIFKLTETLPTRRDYIGKFMKSSNYIQTRRHHKRLWIEHADSISCLTLSNDMIYSGSWDRTIKVWRLTDFKCLESIKAHDDAINALVSSKNTVYSASADGKVKAWERRRVEPKGLHYLKATMEAPHSPHHDLSMNSVVVSGDHKAVYGGASDGYVRVWSVESWKCVCEVEAHKMAILCMGVKGEILCTGSSDRSIGIWKREVKGLSKIGVMKGHEGPIKCLQVSPSSIGGGFLVYSGGLDKCIRVWWVPHCFDKTNEGFESSLHSKKIKITPILF